VNQSRSNNDNVETLKKYAIIAGERVALPVDAKFYFQDKRGLWFWSARKPRVMEEDWTPNKSPVQIETKEGFRRCLMTNPDNSARGAWKRTVAAAVNLDNRPRAMATNDGARAAGGCR
jgi:hypothetical protein